MRPVLGPQLSELNSLFSRFDNPPGGQYNGWYQYFDRDIDKLLKIKQPQPFRNAYCGAAASRAAAVPCGRRWNRPASSWPSSTARRIRRRGASAPHRSRSTSAPLPLITHDVHEPAERDPAGDPRSRATGRTDARMSRSGTPAAELDFAAGLRGRPGVPVPAPTPARDP